MKRQLLPWLCCVFACGSDVEPAEQRTPAAASDGAVSDAAATLDGSAEQPAVDAAPRDASATSESDGASQPARNCKAASRLSFQAQASYPAGVTYETPFDCGPAGHVLQQSGPPENRVNLVILGDGYRQAELATIFNEHVTRFVQHMFSAEGEPYASYRKYINVCSIDVASNQSGTDIPDENVQVDTAFDGNGSDN